MYRRLNPFRTGFCYLEAVLMLMRGGELHSVVLITNSGDSTGCP